MLGALFAAMILVPAGSYAPFYSKSRPAVPVAPFLLDEFPVTNGQFLEFVASAPAWRRGLVKAIFAEPGYLAHWEGDRSVAGDLRESPVTRVSWFAARAYCRARGARLPSTAEWEFGDAAGKPAGASSRDALVWYSTPTPARLPAVTTAPADALGVHGLQGLVWEWTSDFADLFVGDAGAFVCGAGAADARDAGDYAAFMRFAFRGSLKAAYTTGNLGFRCAKDPSP